MATASALSRGARPAAVIKLAQLLLVVTRPMSAAMINPDTRKLRAWDGVISSSSGESGSQP